MLNGANAPLDAEARRLLWHCRRGMKELDVLLERYASQSLAGAACEERAVLERLLELPDPELARYLLAGAVPDDAACAALIESILAVAGAPPRSGAGSQRPPRPGTGHSEI